MSTPTITSSAQAFVDGAFVDAISGETFDLLYCGDVGRIVTVAACGPDDLDPGSASATSQPRSADIGGPESAGATRASRRSHNTASSRRHGSRSVKTRSMRPYPDAGRT